MNVSGTLAVEEAAVKLKAHLLLASLLFKGAIENRSRGIGTAAPLSGRRELRRPATGDKLCSAANCSPVKRK